MSAMATYGEERTGYVEPAWRPMPTEMTESEAAARAASLRAVARAHEVHAVTHVMTEAEFYGEGELAA